MHNSPAACTYFIVQRNKQGELAVSDTARRDKQIKLLEEAIQAIAQHPTLDTSAKNRGIQPLKMALMRLAKEA